MPAFPRLGRTQRPLARRVLPPWGVLVEEPPPEAPSVVTGIAIELGHTVATLRGTVNPNKQATEVWFEWGPSASYGSETAKVAAGSGSASVPASAEITGLEPAHVYHFRISASNATGTVHGSDVLLETVAEDAEPELATLARPRGHLIAGATTLYSA